MKKSKKFDPSRNRVTESSNFEKTWKSSERRKEEEEKEKRKEIIYNAGRFTIETLKISV